MRHDMDLITHATDSSMVIISESVHPLSLDSVNQRNVIILRDQGYTCGEIASRVVNI